MARHPITLVVQSLVLCAAFFSSPALAKGAPGIGMIACRDYVSAELVATRLANKVHELPALLVGTTCSPVGPFLTTPEDRAAHPAVFGPVTDWEGDHWMVYAVPEAGPGVHMFIMFEKAKGGYVPEGEGA